MNLNKVILVGRVVADVEMRTTPSGANVTSLRMVTNRITKDPSGNTKEYAEFHNVVLWRRLAEIASQYIIKGQMILIEGRLQTRNWEGKDGITRYTTEVVADNLQLGPKPQGSANKPATSDETPPPPDESATSTRPTKDDSDGNDEEIKVEDIPF